jgi:hypothetical protein
MVLGIDCKWIFLRMVVALGREKWAFRAFVFKNLRALGVLPTK